MWCPQCKTEYREGFFKCADCHVPLIEHLPPEPEPEPKSDFFDPSIEPVLLGNYSMGLEEAMIESILSEHKIPFYKLHEFSAGQIIGNQLYGVDVFVPSTALKNAKELVDAYTENAGDIEDGEEISWDDEDTDVKP